MSETLRENLFLTDRDLYLSARRWQLIVFIFLFGFYVILFLPYISSTVDVLRITTNIYEAQGLEKKLTAIGATLDALRAATVEAATTRLTSLRGDLILKFDRLNAVVAKLASMTPDEAAGKRGEDLFESPDNPRTMVAQMPVTPSQNAAIPVIEAEVRRAISAAEKERSRDDLDKALDPYVEGQIIQPAFTSFNEAWAQQEPPIISSALQAVIDQISKARAQYSNREDVWDKTSDSAHLLASKAQALNLTEPPNKYWWKSRSAKLAAIHRPLIALSDTVAEDQFAPLTALLVATKETIDFQQAQQKTAQDAIKKLEEEFEEQKAVVSPLKAVGLDLRAIVVWFPLILGVALAGSVVWTAVQLQQLADTVVLLSDQSSAALPAHWLAIKVQRGRRFLIFLKAAVFLLWIVAAGVGLSRLPDVGFQSVFATVSIGGFALIASACFQWRIVSTCADRIKAISIGSAV